MLPYVRRWFVYYAGSKEKAIYSTTKFKKIYIFQGFLDYGNKERSEKTMALYSI